MIPLRSSIATDARSGEPLSENYGVLSKLRKPDRLASRAGTGNQRRHGYRLALLSGGAEAREKSLDLGADQIRLLGHVRRRRERDDRGCPCQEAGRGFAVVAAEVKSLTEQTAKAPSEISQQIAGIQSISLMFVTTAGLPAPADLFDRLSN